jgi:hypothetical protein
MVRRPALIIVVLAVLAIVGLIRFWSDHSTTEDTGSSTSKGASQQQAASRPTTESKSAALPPVAGGTTIAETRSLTQRAPVQINVQAPATVRSGESFQASVDVEANDGIRQLAFSVNYNKHVLQLLESSGGAFVHQGGVPAQFGAQEPSDGNILVNLDVDNGASIAGSGSVAILQFQTLKAGTSPLTVDSVTLVERDGPGTSTAISIHQGSVIVD